MLAALHAVWHSIPTTTLKVVWQTCAFRSEAFISLRFQNCQLMAHSRRKLPRPPAWPCLGEAHIQWPANASLGISESHLSPSFPQDDC